MYTYKYSQYNPIANSNSIILGDKYRITILTSKLFRIEYSERGIFEDAQTQTVLNRYFWDVEFRKYETKDLLTVITDDLILKYNKKEFTPYGLSVELNGEILDMYKQNWHFGDWPQNLKGTTRTLDGINGALELEDGVLSKTGIAILDDSGSPIFGENGWHKNRDSNDYDLYIFGFKRDYLSALDAFYKLSGKQPIIPRFALGNWWSRFYKYSEQTYLSLVDKFENKNIPFSTMVIDMDWHLTELDPKYGAGWTGFTWNKELFPNPSRFLGELKNRGYKTTLNLHPADGIRSFETGYREMAEELGVDFENEQTIDYNPYSKEMMTSLFTKILYPLENEGVDFWWMDWQQSPHRKNKNIDPLWIINHAHYQDNQKDGLGLTFSRYFGPGSHRYPIGFSGDSVISWESLDFQPYFTSTASNIGFGWWSHDIGGHMWGEKDDELMLRWLQLGVFSPINRLHSSNSDFLGKEPWNFRKPYSDLMIEYLRLRHAFIPYIYTMNVKGSNENIPLIRPMYYKYPYFEEAYEVKNQYYFGDNLVVAPFTTKSNIDTLLSEFSIWLPEGMWIDIQTGLKYDGGKTLKIFRPIENIGLFAEQGAIIPLTDMSKYTNSVENPENLEIIVIYGKDGTFDLIEDECITKLELKGDKFTIYPAKGDTSTIPQNRKWKIKVFGIKISGYNYDEEMDCTIIEKFGLISDEISFEIKDYEFVNQHTNKLNYIFNLLNRAQISNTDKDFLYNIIKNSKDVPTIITKLMSLNRELHIINPLLEILLKDDYYS